MSWRGSPSTSSTFISSSGGHLTVNWGIVGIGLIAGARLAPAITADPQSRLVAVASRDRGRAGEFAATHGAAQAYGDYDELLADPDVDVVLVATPNGLHADQVVAAARAGKHVFCDKPLATTVEDAERAVEACRAAGVKLGVNFEFRHAQPYRAIRDAIRSGAIGDVRIAQIESGAGILPHAGWRADAAMAGLGTTFNIAVHLYDVLRFVLGAEIVEVTSLLDVGTRAGTDMETTSLVMLRFDNGTLASVNANQVAPKPLNDVVFHGTRGRIDSRGLGSLAHILRNRLPSPPVHITTDDGEETLELEVADVFERSIAAFADAIVNDRAPDPGGEDGVRSVAVAQAIALSARTRTTVQLATAPA